MFRVINDSRKLVIKTTVTENKKTNCIQNLITDVIYICSVSVLSFDGDSDLNCTALGPNYLDLLISLYKVNSFFWYPLTALNSQSDTLYFLEMFIYFLISSLKDEIICA